MSANIDERVVALHFQNDGFEKGARESLKTLDELKKGLNFDKVGESLEKAGNWISKSLGLSDTTKETTKLGKAFKTIGNIGKIAYKPIDLMGKSFEKLNGYVGKYLGYNVASKIVNNAEKMLRAFTVDPVMAGWQEYELKMDSIKTIMTGTQGEFMKSMGDAYTEEKHLGVVKDYLEQLNKYADDTIYSFKDMTSNIGKFTNNGVSLEKSVLSMEGIANAAARAGQGTQQASMAMYNLSQAIGMGKLTTLDWKSVENANMATLELKQSFIDVGLAMGTLKKEQGKIFATKKGGGIDKNMEVTAENFRNTLSAGWANTEVIVATLAAYSGEMSAEVLAADYHMDIKTAQKLVEIGQAAKQAATEVRTFSKMMDALKEAAQSGWAISFEMIFGDANEAKELWTGINKKLSDALEAGAEKRNDILRAWRGKVTKSDQADWETYLSDMFKAEETGYWDEYHLKSWFGQDSGVPKMVQAMVSEWDLNGITEEGNKKLIQQLQDEWKLTEKDATDVVRLMGEKYKELGYVGTDGRDDFIAGIHNIIDAFLNLGTLFGKIKTAVFGETTGEDLKSFTEKFKNVTESIKNFTAALSEGKTFEDIKNFFVGFGAIIESIWGSIKSFASFLSASFGDAFSFLVTQFGKLGNFIAQFKGETLSQFFSNIYEKLKGLTKVKIAEWFKKMGKTVGTFFKTIGKNAIEWLTKNGYESLAKKLTAAWEKIKGVWTKVSAWKGWTKIGQFLGDITSWILDKAGKAASLFKAGPNGEPSAIASFVTNAYNKISTAWNSVVNWPGWKTVGQFLGGIWSWVKSTYGIVVGYFTEGENGEPSAIESFLTSAGDTISAAWNATLGKVPWKQVGMFISDIWGWIKDQFGIRSAAADAPTDGHPHNAVFEFADEVAEASADETMMKINQFGQLIEAIQKVISDAGTIIKGAWDATLGAVPWEEVGAFFSDIWAWIVSKATGAISAFKPGPDGEPSAVAKWLENARQTIEDTWRTIENLPIWETIGNVYKSIKDWIISKATIVTGAFKPGKDGQPSNVQQWLLNAYAKISGVWNRIENLPIWETIGNIYTSIKDWIISKATIVAGAFKPGPEGEPSTVSQWLENARQTIEDTWRTIENLPIWEILGNVFRSIKDWIISKATAVKGAFTPGKNGQPSDVQQWILNAYAKISGVWNRIENLPIWETIGNVYKSIKDWIVSKATIVAGAFQPGPEGEPSTVTQWLENARQTIEDTWRVIENLPIWETLGGVFRSIKDWILSKAGAVKGAFTPGPDGEPSAVAKWLDSAYQIIDGAWSDIAELPIWETIGNVLSSIKNWILSKATAVAGAFKAGKDGQPSDVARWINSAYAKISGAWTKISELPIWETLGNIFTDIKQWIVSKATMIKGAFTPGPEGEPSTISEWITGAYETISSAWETVKDPAFWQEVGGFFGDLGSWVIKQAQGVIGWFTPDENGASGISTFLSSAKETVSGVYSDVIEWEGWPKIGQFLNNLWDFVCAVAVRGYNAVTKNPEAIATTVMDVVNGVKGKVETAWKAITAWGGWAEIGTFLSNTLGWIMGFLVGSAKAEDAPPVPPAEMLKKNGKETGDALQRAIVNYTDGLDIEPTKVPTDVAETLTEIMATAGEITEAGEAAGAMKAPTFLQQVASFFAPIGDFLKSIFEGVSTLAQSLIGGTTKIDAVLGAIVNIITSVGDVMRVIADLIINVVNGLQGKESTFKQGQTIVGLCVAAVVTIITKFLEWRSKANSSGSIFGTAARDPIGSTLLKMAGAIALVAVALDMIAKINPDNLKGAVAIVVGIGLIITAIMMALGEKWKLENNKSARRTKAVEDISKYLIKWAALFGIIAVTMKALPSILSTMATENISGDAVMSLFEGLTMFIGGIILISSLSGTKLFATADAWYNQLISAATMIGVIAVTFALLPPVIEALGKSGIGDKNILETFEGLTMFIGGIGLVLGILGKVTGGNPLPMIGAAVGLGVAISLFATIVLAAVRGLEELFDWFEGADDQGNGLLQFITRLGEYWKAIRTAMLGGVAEGMASASTTAGTIDVDNLKVLLEATRVCTEMTGLLKKWAEEYKFGGEFENFKSEVPYITEAIQMFAEGGERIANSADLTKVKQLTDVIQQLMIIGSLGQFLSKDFHSGDKVSKNAVSNYAFDWFQFAAGLDTIVNGLMGQQGDIERSLETFTNFTEMFQGAIDEAAANINVLSIVDTIAKGITDPKNETKIAMAFQQLSTDLDRNYAITKEKIEEMGEKGAGTAGGLDNFNLLSTIFKGFSEEEYGELFDQFKIGNIKDYINPEGQTIDVSEMFGFNSEDIQKMLTEGFDLSSLKEAMAGENGENLMNFSDLINSDYSASVTAMMDGMQAELDKADSQLTVHMVADWNDTDFDFGNASVIGVVQVSSEDITSITTSINTCMKEQIRTVVTAVNNLGGKINGVAAAISNMKIVLNTGAIAGEVDKKLGQQRTTNERTQFHGPATDPIQPAVID